MPSDAEFSALRREIVEYSGKIIDLTKFSIVTSVALLGFAAGSGKHGWLIALLPLLVVFPLSELILNYKFQIARIASYLRVFHKEFPYESRLFLARKRPARAFHPSFEIGTFGSALAIGLASSIVSLLLGLENMDSWRPLVTACVAAAWAVLVLRLYTKTRHLKLGMSTDESMEEMWGRIAQEEEADAP